MTATADESIVGNAPYSEANVRLIPKASSASDSSEPMDARDHIADRLFRKAPREASRDERACLTEGGQGDEVILELESHPIDAGIT